MKKTVILYIILGVILFGLKQHYSTASVDSLKWILAPTSAVVSVVTGVPFAEQSGEGFVNYDVRVIIAKACAGINFLIILAAMITVPVLYRLKRFSKGLFYIIASMGVAYLFTIVVNTLRIVISMELFDLTFYTETITKDLVHKLAGIGIYFSSLLILYPLIMNSVERFILKVRMKRSSLVPLTSYLAVTLLIPVLNNGGSLNWSLFMNHHIYVLTVPLLLIAVGRLFHSKEVHDETVH